ncbi:hypothetical protein BDB00DRAFT_869337 [Zychaea mexicana]|uniref:uncharacterized protein n=1 Tax=Zychaea mexicana TaxID=64656 RepID=UPI0022FF142D|nr:uncharacterized protein BDB00DRAFT_869337 [Zychaea mexicana]KAI9496394.1 hypothetical protein BDB00DRAFT_869337 [Zychaea mexicana]
MFQRLHKKSASCTALPALSASSSISTQSQPPPLSHVQQQQGHNDYYHHHTESHSSRTDSSHRSSNSSSSSSGSSIQSNRSSNHNWTKTALPSQEENTTVRSGLSSLLKHKASPFPLPSVCIFSRKALQNEYADHQEIVPYVNPASVPIDQVSMLVSVLESLFRTVDEVLLDGENAGPEQEHEKMENEEQEDCRIIGLGTFKVVSWTLGDIKHATADDLDMALAVILSTQFADRVINEHIKAIQFHLAKMLDDEKPIAEIGSKLFALVEQLFIPH